MSFAVLTPTSTTPQGIDHSRGGGEMFNFFFFFFLSHSPRACKGLLGVGKGGTIWGGYLEISTCATQPQELGSLLAPFLCQAPPLEPGIQGKGSVTAFSYLHLWNIGKTPPGVLRGGQEIQGSPLSLFVPILL